MEPEPAKPSVAPAAASAASAVSAALALSTLVCCVGPLFALVGASGAVAAATFAQYRYYFLGGSGGLLALGLATTLRGVRGGSCRRRPGRVSKGVLLAAVVLFLAATVVNLVMG